MRGRIAVPAALGLLLLAFGVAATTPTTAGIEAPFAVRGEIGDEIVSQHMVATVRGVSLAHEIEIDAWEGTTAGVWLVGEATLAGTVSNSGVDIDVLIDGVRYPASSRAGSDTLDGRVVEAGFTSTGPFAVELPADVADRPGARSAILRFSPGGDTRLGSVIEIVLDLTALDAADRTELEPMRDGPR